MINLALTEPNEKVDYVLFFPFTITLILLSKGISEATVSAKNLIKKKEWHPPLAFLRNFNA